MGQKITLHQGRPRRTTWPVVVAVAGAAFVLGRASVHSELPERARALPAEISVDQSDVSSDRRRQWDPPRLATRHAPAVPQQGGDAELAAEQARSSRATFLIDQVFKRVQAMGAVESLPSAEAQATAVAPYAKGLLEGAIQADPQMRAAFATQIQSRLCGGAPKDAESIVLARMVLAWPDIGTHDGFECFFSRATEDVPLWSMMDAWRNSGLPKTAALSKLEASAADPRTVRRFLPLDEEAQRRTAFAEQNNHQHPTGDQK